MTATDRPFETVCVVGLGYVGLPTAAVFASRGVRVLGVDIDETAVAAVNSGRIHIVEPDLDVLVEGAVARGTLRAATTPEPADAFVLAVPTPFKDDRTPDVSYVERAARAVAPVLKAGDLVVVESTCPVGTTEAVSAWLAEMRDDLRFPHTDADAADVFVAHSPERVLPGRVLIELLDNDRVIGGVSPASAQRAAALFRLAVKGDCHLTDARTAELVKLSENAYRDVNIAFANELAAISETLGIDPWDVVELANRHPRVNILKPGPGVGGHCIAVDPWFIVDSAPDAARLIRTARAVNDARPHEIARRIADAAQAARAVKGEETTVRVACLGLSYKADIDDLRESPAVAVCAALADDAGLALDIVEPHAQALPPVLSGRASVRLAALETAVTGADVIAVLTDHTAFRGLTRADVAGAFLVDARGLFHGRP
jgi:UDP-N-acetyl-D-mannosaminuronic acid dehydrogenase